MKPQNFFSFFRTFFLPVFIVLTIFSSSDLFSQTVRYNSVPVNLQFFPRNAQDSGTVTFSGDVQTAGYDSISVELYKNAVLTSRKSQTLTYNMGNAPFSISHKIKAELSRYSFKVYVNSNLVRTVDSVACGDVYLIMGQSNAVEINSTFTYKDEFCRTFGKHTGNYNGDSYNPADTQWALSTANAGGVAGNTPNVGVWSLQLQKLIRDNYSMPTLFINGGRASGFLSIQLRNNSNPEDLTSIYGKLLYRVRKAKVANDVKAIIFYGGESDGYPPGFNNYLANWGIINSQWLEDYPGFSKIFCLQVRPGCSSGEELDQLREKQRQLGALYPNLELFSTSGISNHFGCHYGLNGYQELANYLIKNVSRKFYGSTDTVNILPPNIRAAFYNTAHDKIKLLFSGSNVTSWPADTVYGDVTVVNHAMKDYFYLNGVSGNVTGGTISGDTLILNLAAPSFATKLSYLPASRDHTDQQVYEGPFIRNSRRIGALTFYEFPIADSMITPVNFYSLNAYVNKRDVTLSWVTASETNNKGFDIERFRIEEGSSWIRAGFVAGHGNSTIPVTYNFTDYGLTTGKYHYRIKQLDVNGNFEYFDLQNEIYIGLPRSADLYQNYPNPFNPSTKIDYDIPADGNVTLTLFDMTGKTIRVLEKKYLPAGSYTYRLDGTGLPSGMYLYSLEVNGNIVKSMKMTLVK